MVQKQLDYNTTDMFIPKFWLVNLLWRSYCWCQIFSIGGRRFCDGFNILDLNYSSIGQLHFPKFYARIHISLQRLLSLKTAAAFPTLWSPLETFCGGRFFRYSPFADFILSSEARGRLIFQYVLGCCRSSRGNTKLIFLGTCCQLGSSNSDRESGSGFFFYRRTGSCG